MTQPANTEHEFLQKAFRYALSLTHSEEDAKDLVQESWLKVYRRKGRVKEKALLFTTIRNLFIDQYRHNKAFGSEPIEVLDNVIQGNGADSDPILTMDELGNLLKNLRTIEREVLFLSAVEGYTAEEIGGITNLSRGTVLSLMHRARNKLTKMAGELKENGKGVHSHQ